MPFFYPSTPVTLSGKTLVVPCVSTANVSQLAIDLLIASLSLRRVGTFDPVDLVPVVGAREDGEEGVMTPLELFGLEDIDILVVHQRSPVLRSRKAEFIDSLLTFITESEFAAVLFLSGIDLSNRTDAQMPTPDYHIIPPNAPALHSTPLGNLHSLVPTYTSPLSISEIPAAENRYSIYSRWRADPSPPVLAPSFLVGSHRCTRAVRKRGRQHN